MSSRPDYRETLFLPKTAFPMRARLAAREPEMIARWEAMDLWARLRETARGRTKYILHDGPPYANGQIHIGTALNKILKDFVNRTRQMAGFDAHYIPGWDCHGLPIEWQIEQEYRKRKQSREDVPIAQFRRECRAFAEKWIGVQMEDFRRLFVVGDWAGRYLTMDFKAEAQIVREIGKFLLEGSLYRGLKPVMWSPVERTALAEAEVEYRDITSTAVFARFPISQPAAPALEGADVVIWTTTPWTLPANRAIAFGADIDYTVLEVQRCDSSSGVRPGDRLVIATARVPAIVAAASIEGFEPIASLSGSLLTGTVCSHPIAGYDHPVPLHAADFVGTDQGTGLVHVAPAHGDDDFELGQRVGLKVTEYVGDDGRYSDIVPRFAGIHVFKADQPVLAALEERGKLLATEKHVHSYPHSWRSKQPVIYRATQQWFISMESHGLRAKALAAVDATEWVPASARNRIRGMIEHRPDWCVSRQRAWGVPIPVFVDRRTREPLRDEAVLRRVVEAVEAEGADAWFTRPPSEFLGPGRDPDDFDRTSDILDVWFDSGCTHSFVLENNPDQHWPADLYLEGTDQHRGWFHSSLLASCGTRGRAPYRSVLTHGFVLDGDGRKMSKSAGNVVRPQEINDTQGADILRLWVALSDSTGDLRIGDQVLAGISDAYRRFRNTLRFVLGNLADFSQAEQISVEEMPDLEKWVLHRLHELEQTRVDAFAAYDFQAFYRALHNFCANDLSSFYFDVRKDSLYCDRADTRRRRAARSTLFLLHDILTAWLAPVLCFTAEEAWLERHPAETESVHLRAFPEIPKAWQNDAVAGSFATVRRVRNLITSALEIMRRDHQIGSSLEAQACVHADADLLAGLASHDLAELAIASRITLSAEPPPADAYQDPSVPGVAVHATAADGMKCARCWRVLAEVEETAAELCGRCREAV